MVERWSEAWVAALDEAARADERLLEASRGRHITVGQEVLDGDQVRAWHLVLADGMVAVRPGPADQADVTFSQDRAVAEAVTAGTTSARTEFVLGHIRIGGDTRVLLELAPLLADLDGLAGGLETESAAPDEVDPRA